MTTRSAELMHRSEWRVISCELGDCGWIQVLQNGKSGVNSFGSTPQSGLPHNNRVGDFDPYVLLKVLPRLGLSYEQALSEMAKNGGLLGISGVSNDLREIEAAAASGNKRAQLAFDVFVQAIRDYIGAYLAVLNGADLIVFTGGIGENSITMRTAICDRMDYA